MIYLKVTTDPIELWASPASRSRVEKDFFDSNFRPFFRTSQVSQHASVIGFGFIGLFIQLFHSFYRGQQRYGISPCGRRVYSRGVGVTRGGQQLYTSMCKPIFHINKCLFLIFFIFYLSKVVAVIGSFVCKNNNFYFPHVDSNLHHSSPRDQVIALIYEVFNLF